MILPSIMYYLLLYIAALVSMAFYTLLERKSLGYVQYRKGPNKVSTMGTLQPFADALKLFSKELKIPSLSNLTLFYISPMLSLLLALMIWSLLPTSYPTYFMSFSILVFLAISSLNVYSTLGAGWSSNSKYSLLGALRSIAQTISYEVSMTLILLGALIFFSSYSFFMFLISKFLLLMLPITFFVWFITTLAETNRTPFDFAEGESELVSGFNTEYSSGSFAMIFMAEYASIVVMALLTTILFFSFNIESFVNNFFTPMKGMIMAFIYIWARGTLPRLRYDRLMSLTWKCFLPYSLAFLIFFCPVLL